MSVFSGKCDFYDGFVMIRCDGDENKVQEKLSKLTLYIIGKDKREHLVKSDTIKDIAKYYPYLESIMYSSKEGGVTVILSSDSFIDQEEREMRDYKVKDVMKHWRKCKREKKPFNKEEYLSSTWYSDKEDLATIFDRVAKDGDKAEFDDIHLPMWEHNRRRWFEELVRLGYTEHEAYAWCFKGLFDSEEEIKKRLGRSLKN